LFVERRLARERRRRRSAAEEGEEGGGRVWVVGGVRIL
jgi:hypothetical protein